VEKSKNIGVQKKFESKSFGVKNGNKLVQKIGVKNAKILV